MGHGPPMGYGANDGLWGRGWAMGSPVGYGAVDGLWGRGWAAIPQWAMGSPVGYGANDGLWGPQWAMGPWMGRDPHPRMAPHSLRASLR